HGFGGTKNDTAETARTLARDGYTVITFTARGFGASGGLIHLDHPDYEGADARRIIDFAADRPEVSKVGRDPVIGFAGASYGGALALLAAGLDPRVDAIVPAFTWNRLDHALFPQYQVAGAAASLADVTPAARGGVFKRGWASRLFTDAGGREGPAAGDPLCGRFTAELCSGYRSAAETGRATPALTALLAQSGPHQVLSKVTAPTLIIGGEDDTLFPLDQADANLRGLPASTPARMKWVAGGHDGELSVDDLLEDMQSWFGRYLQRNGSASDTSFSVLVPETSLVGEGGVRDPETRVAAGYPGRGSERREQRFALDGERQTILAPPGGTPAALTNLPGTGGALAAGATSVAGYALAVLPGQSATFTTKPVPDPVPVIGSGRVDIEVTSSATSATLFVSLWDLGPEIERSVNGRTTPGPSSAVLPQLVVAPVQVNGLIPGRAERVTVALPPVSHQVPVEHRLQLVVSTTDQAYALPSQAAVYQVALAGEGALLLPDVALEVLGGNTLDVPLPLIVVVALLGVAAAVAMAWLWRRHRSVQPEPDLAEVPLVVTDVVKTYKEGIRAVDGISFRAETGQVVGLLGPNGAGKTTAMRMLVGLIRPDSGEIYVHGEPVHAGADVLASVGAFIEGPGFLPHLTGGENLHAYWQATGRPTHEAHLEEALEIAGLGAALDRRVRGYSHGMLQRLGIAQAMLGLPSLLVLDEPTNGLDPPQIKAMREVLADYAAAGRTVVISSHLLGEVEQTCSHVVVMDQGKIVLTGAVSALTASDTVTMIGLAEGEDLSGAERHLDARGISAERAGGVLRVSGRVPRADIVQELVSHGYRVESVDGHRQLEEVFLSIVGGPTDQGGDSRG
ncbi:MAG TPA: alpha/beta fold hydrolase, partial [Propionibacteriaceae bacterium]|nr:alpha/beta fold hydrolase [Propionibacteriaceae bacterium]